MPHKRLISTGSEYESMSSHSRAVVSGDDVLVSGTTGFNDATMRIDASTTAQAEQCFVSISATLRQADCSLDDVIRIRYVVGSRDDFDACLPVIRKHMQRVRPAATMLIAGLLHTRMRIEIDVTARKAGNVQRARCFASSVVSNAGGVFIRHNEQQQGLRSQV